MSWKFWKKEEETETITNAVSYSTLYRWVCYDLGIANLDELDKKLGLTPISDDAKTMEQRESKMRMLPVAQLFPFFELIATINAEIAVETKVEEMFANTGLLVESEEMDVMKEAMSLLHSWSGLSSIATAFSIAQHLGIITISPTTMAEVGPYEFE